MGREARCACRWGKRSGTVTALLESHELIVRGEVRARAALATLERVDVRGKDLVFFVADEPVALELGAKRAQSWAAALAAGPPTLARKLGIARTTRLHVTGTIDDDELRAAVAEGAATTSSLATADLALVRTDDLATILKWVNGAPHRSETPPVWIVYVKGRTAPLGETTVRETMRTRGFIDTKVAAVSNRLTALRFVQKKTSPRP